MRRGDSDDIFFLIFLQSYLNGYRISYSRLAFFYSSRHTTLASSEPIPFYNLVFNLETCRGGASYPPFNRPVSGILGSAKFSLPCFDVYISRRHAFSMWLEKLTCFLGSRARVERLITGHLKSRSAKENAKLRDETLMYRVLIFDIK